MGGNMHSSFFFFFFGFAEVKEDDKGEEKMDSSV